ncbi:hypothetical protein GGR51DRAFT_573570 [Nemania sp. FL0031]|nr:hypothetical protein GGR51DRAFT_573570 [Nemania sp. FL0031]
MAPDQAVLPMEYISLHESALVHKTEGDVLFTVEVFSDTVDEACRALIAAQPEYVRNNVVYARLDSAIQAMYLRFGEPQPWDIDYYIEEKKRSDQRSVHIRHEFGEETNSRQITFAETDFFYSAFLNKPDVGKIGVDKVRGWARRRGYDDMPKKPPHDGLVLTVTMDVSAATNGLPSNT